MRLNDQQVAEIRAAQDVYRAGDVARAYEVSKSTVTRIWSGERRKGIDPAPEPPNIETRKYVKDFEEDIILLRERGMSYEEIAVHIGMSRSAIYAYRGIWL